MPGPSAREMLSKLPLRMANGGDINLAQESALDQSRAYKNALESGGLEGVQAYYANIRDLAGKYMAGTLFEGEQPVGVEAYNIMLESGISNTDLINAGVGQDVLSKIFTTATANPAFDTPAPVESAFMTNPVLAAEAAARSATGVDGVASLQKQGREFVANIQQDGTTPEEQRLLRELALEGGYTLQDIQAAGVDPSILFNIPEAEKPPVVPPVADPFPQTQAPYVAPEVYQPITPQPDIYAAGEPALDVAFRESDPQTEVTEPIFGEDQLVGFDYVPAAQLLSATGSGFSFTPPSVTSRPRSLMPTSQLNRYTRGRAAQDLRQLTGGREEDYMRYKPLLDRTGSYGGGLSRSQLYALMRQEQAREARAAADAGAGAFTPSQSGTIQDYIALNPDVATDFQTQIDEGRLSSDMTLDQFATNHYNTFGLREMEAGTRNPFSLTSGYAGATGALQARDIGRPGGATFFAEGGAVKKPEAVPVDQEPRDTAQTESASMLQNIMSGVSQIPGTVYGYGKDIVQSESPLTELGEDVGFLGKAMYTGLKEDPLGFTLDMLPVVGEIRSGMDADKYSDLANQAEAAGNKDLADTYRQIVAMAAAGVAPMAGMGARAGKRAAISAAEEAATTSARGMLDDIAGASARARAETQLMSEYPAEQVASISYVASDPLTLKFNNEIAADPEAAIRRYENIGETNGGKVLNPDLVRELSEEYRADRSLAGRVHEPSSALTRLMYDRKVAETMGQEGNWIFTGGGPASGKTAGLSKEAENAADLVMDGTMAKFNKVDDQLEKALVSGKTVNIVYIDRDPIKALPLALNRAMETGRPVRLEDFMRMHRDARQSIKKLYDKYKDNDDVTIDIISNQKGIGEQEPINIDQISTMDYDKSLEEGFELLQQFRKDDRINEKIYTATKADYEPVVKDSTAEVRGDQPTVDARNQADGQNLQSRQDSVEPLGVGIDESLAAGQRLRNYSIEQLDNLDSLATNATAGTRAADALINAPVEAGTKVGIRLNLNSRIPDAPRGLDKLQTLHKNNFNGKALSYIPYATVENGTFNVSQTGRRNIVAKISGMDVPEAKSKFPAMSVDGNYAPDRNVLREGGDIVEIGFNPAAHHLFIDMNTGQAVKSFDVATVVGDRVYAKGITYHKKSEAPEPVAASDGTELPSNVRYREMNRGGMVSRKEDNKTYI
jgi:hypothetical protein